MSNPPIHRRERVACLVTMTSAYVAAHPSVTAGVRQA